MEAASASSSNNGSRERRHSLSRLVLYAPLISTRRSASSGSTNSVSRSNSTRRSAATQRVPFSWESSPGVPKSLSAAWHDDDDDDDDVDLPLPLPPKLQAGEHDSKAGKLQILVNEAYRSSDGSYDEEEEEEIFSDALDKMSLSEKFDIACRLSSMDRNNCGGVRRSSSFIMNRFLPAAKALANSSVRGGGAHFGRRVQKEMIKAGIKGRDAVTGKARLHLSQQFDQNAEARRPELNSMACGLMLFFPWSPKPTVCGFKSPARGGAPRLDEPSGCGLRSPAGVRTARPNRAAPPPPKRGGVKGFSDGWSSDAEDSGGGGGGYVGKMSVVKMNQPSWGCGLPFLDTSRLWSKAGGVGIGGERKQRRNEAAGESRRATWMLTQLTSPSESLLSHAIGYVNRGH